MNSFAWLRYFIGTVALFGVSSPLAAQTCAIDTHHPIVIPKKNNAKKDSIKHAYRLADGSIIFLGRFTIDADGAPKAYGPNNSGLDDTANAGHPGDWWGLATDAKNCGPKGKPVIQGAGDPAPGFYVSTTSITDPAVDACTKQRRYVDSGDIPFVALPPAVAKIDKNGNFANMGAMTIVYRPSNENKGYAFQADTAPAYGIGEGSMKLARDLGINDDPRQGGVDGRELVWLVLPQKIGFPKDAMSVQNTVQSAFEGWGGIARLKVCRTALLTAPP